MNHFSAAEGTEKEISLLDPLDPLAPPSQTGMYSSSAPASSTLDNLFGGTSGAGDITGGSAMFRSPVKQVTSSVMFGAPPVVTSSSVGMFSMSPGISVSGGNMSMMMGSPRHVPSVASDVDQPGIGVAVADSGFSVLFGFVQFFTVLFAGFFGVDVICFRIDLRWISFYFFSSFFLFVCMCFSFHS